MPEAGNRSALAPPEHWEAFHAARKPRLRLPSRLVVATRNLHALLRRRVRPGMRVLEIGFAPGKHLAYVAKVLGGRVTGIDYSRTGVAVACDLFRALAVEGDLRCEDIFTSTIAPGTFDLVYSVGVIEHFADPSDLVRRHVELLRPGGSALILIPNYRDLYGQIQGRLDPANLLIHNLAIMTPATLSELAPRDLVARARVFRSGRLDPSQLSLHRRLRPAFARCVHLLLTALGQVQPLEIEALCPWLALEVTRA